jgi:hypothetical protein
VQQGDASNQHLDRAVQRGHVRRHCNSRRQGQPATTSSTREQQRAGGLCNRGMQAPTHPSSAAGQAYSHARVTQSLDQGSRHRHEQVTGTKHSTRCKKMQAGRQAGRQAGEQSKQEVTQIHARCVAPVEVPDGRIFATWSTPMRSASEVCKQQK